MQDGVSESGTWDSHPGGWDLKESVILVSVIFQPPTRPAPLSSPALLPKNTSCISGSVMGEEVSSVPFLPAEGLCLDSPWLSA
jgi:hypothetical protein